LIDIRKDSVPRTLNELVIRLDDRWANQPLVLTYVDMDTSGVSMIFDAGEGLVLLVPQGSFIANYVRALLIVLGQLAFLSALGVTAGCLFSLPVAAFVSLFLLVLMHMGSYIEGIAKNEIVLPWQAASADAAMSWGTILVAFVFKVMALVMSPLMHESALQYVSTGRLVDWVWTLRGLVVQGIIYALLMSLVAARIMNRRELALPVS
jgi:hypothetical protein